MKQKKSDEERGRNFRDFCQEIGIQLDQNKREREMGQEEPGTGKDRILPEICEGIEVYPDTIDQIEEFSNFKAVETRQFFGTQVGIVALNGWVLAKTKEMDWHHQYRCLCCYGSTELELLLTEGRVWQSENPAVLLVRWGSGSICGVRDFIKNTDHPREPLPIDEPKMVCFGGEVSKKTGTVLVSGQNFLVLLGDQAAEKILELANQAECGRKH